MSDERKTVAELRVALAGMNPHRLAQNALEEVGLFPSTKRPRVLTQSLHTRATGILYWFKDVDACAMSDQWWLKKRGVSWPVLKVIRWLTDKKRRPCPHCGLATVDWEPGAISEAKGGER